MLTQAENIMGVQYINQESSAAYRRKLMKRLLFVNAFVELSGSELVESVIISIDAEHEMFLEDETGRPTSIYVENFEKLNNQTARVRQVYKTRSRRIYCSLPWFT